MWELQNWSQEGVAQFIMLSRVLRTLENVCSIYISELISWPIASADTPQVAQVLLSECPREYRSLLSCDISKISACSLTTRCPLPKLSWMLGSLLRVSLRVAAQSLTTAQWSHTWSVFLDYMRTQAQGGMSSPWNSTGAVPWREMAVTTTTCWSSTDSQAFAHGVFCFPLSFGFCLTSSWHLGVRKVACHATAMWLDAICVDTFLSCCIGVTRKDLFFCSGARVKNEM